MGAKAITEQHPGFGYVGLEKIFESQRTTIFRARRVGDDQPVILKMLREEYLDRSEIARYHNQFVILNETQLSCSPKVLGFEKHQNSPVIVFEDWGGSALDTLLRKEKVALLEGMDIACKLAKALVEIHSKAIIHKDINPANILYKRTTGEVKIIDFGISTRLMREQASADSQSVAEGSLAYMSPEQTGRMNRFVDYRSDFYSLGATFYQLFTGRVPFESEDSLRLLHFHMAKKPTPPVQVNPLLPQVLSDLILKLLAKNAEDRYQSAWGIMVDLQKTYKELRDGKAPSFFPLGLQDIPDRFHIPPTLYGRQKQLDQLSRSFQRVRDGEREICLLAGYAGTGKTALVRELHKVTIHGRGHFVAGKFDAFRRNTPYSAVIDALRELVRQLLSEPEAVLWQWREKLLHALGPNGQIVADVIPELELIVGPQPAYALLGSSESENRFKLVFRNFIDVFCNPDQPLVMHLDDMQWMDSASMHFIQFLMRDRRLKAFMLIGCFRDHELSSHHPLSLLIQKLRQLDVNMVDIQLLPLTLEELSQLIADALHSKQDRVKDLAELVLEKTAGNPFFADEFLRNLYSDHLLYFHPDKGQWEWELDTIKSANMTDNVVELMANRIQKLSEDARMVVLRAACIGLSFDLQTLAAISGMEWRPTALLLKEVMSHGLLIPIGDGYRLIELDIPLEGQAYRVEYRFGHDRIQQAAYDLLPLDQQVVLRHRVGRLMLANSEQRELHLFVIVDHLNASMSLIEQESERRELMQLNLEAARKSKSAAAYQSALSYLQAAISLEREGDWSEDYTCLLATYQEAAETAFLKKNYDSMQLYVDVVIKRSKTLLDRIPAYETRLHAAVARNDMNEAIDLGKSVLASLGIKIPENPSLLRIGAAILFTKWRLRNRSTQSLLDLPVMQDPLQLARMHFLYSMAQTIFYFFPRQVPLLTSQLVRSSLTYGNTSTSALAYTTYGMIMAAMLGDVKEGYRFGEIGLKLLEKLKAKDIEAATLVCFNMFIRPWRDHVRMSLEPLLEAHKSGLDSGDFEFAAHAAAGYCNRSFFVGQELKPLTDDYLKFGAVIENLAQKGDLDLVHMLHQMTINFREVRSKPHLLQGDTFDGESMLAVYERNYDAAGMFHVHFFQCVLAFHFDNYSEAAQQARQAEPHLRIVMGTFSGAIFAYYSALAVMADYKFNRKGSWFEIKAQVKKTLKRLRGWSKLAPMNFEHKLLLVEAEWQALSKQPYKAQTAFDAAISAAKSHQYLQDEALANELAARFHLECGRQTAAYAYMRRARYNYERWGATAKVRALEEAYPQILSAMSAERPATGSLATMSSSTIDITTLKRALLAIAEENVHSRMLEKIISSAIEFAGAQRGLLLLKKNDEFFIEAEGSIDQESPRVLQSIALSDGEQFSKMAVNYVRRSRRGLVIDNATLAQEILPGLHLEPYVQRIKVRSLLCIPITVGVGEQSQLSGLLYLENNRASNTFTSERIETLEIICLAAAGRIELSVKAASDGLTGLYNHDYFQNMLEQEMLKSQRQLRNLSLILVDIDHFKQFNDTWGHQVGDTVLKKVAQIIRNTCRKSDIVARYGGEEMAIILPETSKEMAMMVAERIRKAVEQLVVPNKDQSLNVTVSLGIASLSEAVKDRVAMIKRADEALYASKDAGRNRSTLSS